jgi:membrane-bound ClpP family serine protease
VPEPSKGVAIAGWVVLALGIGVANYRTGSRVGIPLGLIAVAAGIAIQKLGHKAASRRLVEEQQQLQQQHDLDEWERQRLWTLVGKAGIAVSDLKACGTVQVDDTILEARALYGYIPKDARVVVSKVEGLMPVVEQSRSDTMAG